MGQRQRFQRLDWRQISASSVNRHITQWCFGPGMPHAYELELRGD